MGNASQSHASGATSRSLLMRLKEEDAAAWRDMVHLYSPLIVYWARKQGARDRDCEDILQDVFRTVITKIGSFRRDQSGGTFRGWLRTITRSRLVDFYRQNSSEPVGIGGTEAQIWLDQHTEDENRNDRDEAADQEQHEYRALYLRAIELIRDEFQEQTWKAFWRTAVDGCTTNEVADELGMRPGTVRVAKSRVLQRLRDRLGDAI